MKNRHFYLWWLILPSVVFFLLVAAFVVKFGRRTDVATEMVASSPSPMASPQAAPPTSGLPSLVDQIAGWRGDDPRLAAPIFDREISLPEE